MSKRKGKGKAKTRRSTMMRGLTEEQLIAEAERAFDRGDHVRTSQLYSQLVSRLADQPNRIMQMAQRDYQNIRYEQVALLLEQLLQRHPNHLEATYLLAWCHWCRSRAESALELALRVVERAPRMTGAHGLAAQCYERLKQPDEERAILEKALAAVPGDPLSTIQLADAMMRCGDLERAREVLEPVLARPNLPLPLQRKGWNLHGFLLDRLGAYDEAFTSFERCGKATSQLPESQERDPGGPYRFISAYTEESSPELFERFREHHAPRTAGHGAEPASPAFLVGFPRSGTTMLEQVLTSQGQVVATNEEPAIVRTGVHGLDLLNVRRPGELLRSITPSAAREMRLHYRRILEPISDRAFKPGTLMLDKFPLNLIQIALINALFPNSPIIVALRDPRDVCLSCLMQDFNVNEGMMQFYTFESTVKFYEAVMNWYLHVKPMLTMPIIEVRYEDTVRDLEWQSKRVLEHLGLEWNPDVLEFHSHTSDRRITTPSFRAVQQPVHTRAVRRWERYADSLRPHLSRLDRFLEAFGYAEDD